MNSARILSIDAEIDRILRLLEIGIEAAFQGDADMANLAADETLKSVARLPAAPIRLPDHFGETA